MQGAPAVSHNTYLVACSKQLFKVHSGNAASFQKKYSLGQN